MTSTFAEYKNDEDSIKNEKKICMYRGVKEHCWVDNKIKHSYLIV